MGCVCIKLFKWSALSLLNTTYSASDICDPWMTQHLTARGTHANILGKNKSTKLNTILRHTLPRRLVKSDFVLMYLLENVLGALLGIRRLPTQQNVRNYARGPNITLINETFLRYYFRSTINGVTVIQSCLLVTRIDL